MSQNLQIDPVKKDYVVKDGSPVPSDRVLEACYYALLIPKNQWLYGATNQGSLLYLLEGIKRSASVEQQFSAYSQDAINQQVVQTGKAKSVSVKNLAVSRTGSSNQIDVVQSQTQLSNQINFVAV